MKKRDIATLAVGTTLGALLVSGANAAAGVMAQPTWQDIYVDGQKVNMTAYNIEGNNYVKLRDFGQAVDINVYWQDGVRIDTGSPYTGEAPAKVQSQATTQATAPAEAIRISSYKDLPLTAGDGSGLMIYPSGAEYTVVSSDPSVVTVEKVLGLWKATAVSPGTAKITAAAPDGRTGSVEITVVKGADTAVDLSVNMDIRQEMIRLINQTRRENGVAELTVNEALMNAAQDCTARMFRQHDSEYECKTAMAYGYPHGFGSNLTWFTGSEYKEVARKAVSNWINSPGHFQAMIDPRCDTIGVGVTIKNGQACCYMFAGDPNSHHPYE